MIFKNCRYTLQSNVHLCLGYRALLQGCCNPEMWKSTSRFSIKSVRRRSAMRQRSVGDEKSSFSTRPTRNAGFPSSATLETLPLRYSHFTEVTRRANHRADPAKAGKALPQRFSRRRRVCRQRRRKINFCNFFKNCKTIIFDESQKWWYGLVDGCRQIHDARRLSTTPGL